MLEKLKQITRKSLVHVGVFSPLRELFQRYRLVALKPRTVAILSAFLLGFGLAACDDKDKTDYKAVLAKRPEDIPNWITVKDTIEPSVWLRSREMGRSVLPTDPEVDRIRHALQQAQARFYEDPRMIANRTAQTWDMLREIGQPEQTVDIMTGMVDVADMTAEKKLYGEMCQHYLNMRKSGLDRTAALNDLMASFKVETKHE